MTSGSSETETFTAEPARPTPVTSFDLQVLDEGGPILTACLRGELDMVTAPGFEARVAELCDRGARNLTLDLAELAFIDSSGLSALVSTLKRLQTAGGDLVLRSPTRATAKVLEICGLNQVFSIEDGAHDQVAPPQAT